MPLNKIRGRLGFWIGEAVQAGLLSLGVFLFAIIALNGLSVRATIHFVDNFTNRFLASEPTTSDGFALGLQILVLALTAIILGVRLIDRRTKRRAQP